MQRIVVWGSCAMIVGLLAFVCWPGGYAPVKCAAEARAIANLEELREIQRQRVERGDPPFTREELRDTIFGLGWPTGRISYLPWFVYNAGGEGNWAVWVEPVASEHDCGEVARDLRLEHLTFWKFGLRSWDLRILKDETLLATDYTSGKRPRMQRSAVATSKAGMVH